jgi:hemolysin activation/secretion protein
VPKQRSDIFWLHCASVLPLGLMLAHAIAAEAPVTPGSVQSGIETGRPRMPATPPQVLLPVQPRPSQHDPRAIRFRVNAFDFSGNTVFRAQLLKRLLDRFVDMELNLYDLNRAADTITEFYHERGYTLARAVIPAQKVVDGRVTIRIVEGRIGRVSFNGNKRFSNGFLAARTKELQPGTLVTSERLESDLLLLNDIPGLSAKAVLEPGATFGATDAEIKVQEKLVSGTVSVNNYGRKETGQNKLEAAFNINSPFGWGDQFAFSGSATQHKLVRYWRVGYSVPLDTAGTRLAISTSKAAYDVSGALAALGVSGDISTTDLIVTHPFVRTRNDSQWLNVGVKHSHLTQNALGAQISDNAINVLTLNYLINHIHDDASVTNANFGLTTNFKSVKTPTQQDAVFARMEADVSHTTPFYKQWDMFLRGNMVYSKEMLPDTEKFSLGGPGSVRAFRPSEVRGDTGYVATLELRRPFSAFSRMGSFRLTSDIGEVIYKMPGFNNSRDRLRSVGLGATFYPATGTTISFDAARQIGPSGASNDGSKTRLWMNISASF